MKLNAPNGCIVLIVLCFRADAFHFKTVTSVTNDVIMKYNSVCVYLMHSERQGK